jgi:hypothetical protein
MIAVSFTLPAIRSGMKVPGWDHEPSAPRVGEARLPRRKTVAQILRAAYQKHVRDRQTRQAVRRCLR